MTFRCDIFTHMQRMYDAKYAHCAWSSLARETLAFALRENQKTPCKHLELRQAVTEKDGYIYNLNLETNILIIIFWVTLKAWLLGF